MEARRLTTDEQIAELGADMDVFWLLFGSVLVFFMQTGGNYLLSDRQVVFHTSLLFFL